MATYAGKLNQAITGKPIAGVLGVIYDADGLRKDAHTTDQYGDYIFYNLITGPHTIRWYGRGYGDTDVEYVNVIEDFLDETVAPIKIEPDFTTNGSDPIKLTVSEDTTFLDADEGFHNPTAAKLTLENVGILEGTPRTISFEYRESRKNLDNDFDQYISGSPTSTTHQWKTLGTQQVEWSPGNTSKSYTYETTIAGIPAEQNSIKKYQFRASLLNGSNSPGLIQNPIDSNTSGFDFATYKGECTFTYGLGPDFKSLVIESKNPYHPLLPTGNPWINWMLGGRTVRVYNANAIDGSKEAGFLFEGVCYVNVSNQIVMHFPEDPMGATTGYNTGSVTPAFIDIPNTPYIYPYSVGGNGIEFNGINDLDEYVAVSGLTGLVDKNMYRLEWDNMFEHTGAVGQQAIDAGGNAHEWKIEELKHISHYGIWVFVSHNGQSPSTTYPSGADTNGEWNFFADIDAPKLKATSLGGDGPEKVSYDLDVPGGTSLAIWVGARTSTTLDRGDNGTWQTETSTDGSPSGSNNRAHAGTGSLGGGLFNAGDAE